MCRENRALSGVPCVMRRDVCFIMFIMSVCRKKLCWLIVSMLQEGRRWLKERLPNVPRGSMLPWAYWHRLQEH